MPLYQCVVAEGTVHADQRAEIAGELTRIHCELTDAPIDFADVIFLEVPRGAGFTANGPLTTFRVAGYILAGRSPELRLRLMTAIADAVGRIAGVPRRDIVIALADFPAQWMMRDGRMMPEPGQEAEWLAQAVS